MVMPAAPDTLPCAAAREIVEASVDWVSLIALNGRIRYLNRLGRLLAQEFLIGRPEPRRWLDIWPSAERDVAHGAYAVALSGGRGAFRGYCPAQDGTPHWWDVSLFLLEDVQGAPDGVIAIAHEVSAERRVLDLEREARQARLSGSDSAAAHDILSALTVIKGEAQILARRVEKAPAPLRESWLRSTAAINTAADRVRTLVSGRLFATAKSQDGRVPLPSSRTSRTHGDPPLRQQ